MPSLPPFDAPTPTDVRNACEVLRDKIVQTPLLSDPLLDRRVGGRLLIKAEPLQHTGSFKFRGAYNRLSRLGDAARRRGVVAYSSGNHAQGVAWAAHLLGIPAVIVMPADAPPPKIEATRAFGGEVVLYDRKTENREAIGEAIASDRGLTLVRPYDDPWVIAGQGTLGLELARQAKGLGIEHLDAVIIPCSGGGLAAGCALAFSEEMPDSPLYVAEPAGFDDTRRSLEAGRRLSNAPDGKSFCDALMAPTPGELTFAINRRLLAGGFAVTDTQVETAMAAAFSRLKLVVEPGGAVALAAALAGSFDCSGRTVAVVCSGGNVAPGLFADILERAARAAP